MQRGIGQVLVVPQVEAIQTNGRASRIRARCQAELVSADLRQRLELQALEAQPQAVEAVGELLGAAQDTRKQRLEKIAELVERLGGGFRPGRGA